MKTSWGEIAVCDSHVHLFSRSFYQALAGDGKIQKLREKLGWDIPGPDVTKLAARWVKELDRHHVKRTVLIASTPGDENSAAAAVRAFPKRLIGFFMLDPTAPDAVGRARRALDELGLKGISLFPAMHRFSVHDPRLRPILELADSHSGTIVFVHMGVLTVGVRKRLGLPSPFDIRFSNPIDLHSVAHEFLQVNFVIPHFGAGYFRETLMLGDLCPNVHLDTSSSNSWIRYLPDIRDLADVFRRALAVYGSQRLLFGTDSSYFPRGWNTEIIQAQMPVLEHLGLGRADATAILGGNLERLLRLQE